jgi:sporulation protein YlmC with PRC-barrel domain
MNIGSTLLAASTVFAVVLVPPAFAQGTPQTMGMIKVDLKSVETGYRVSKVVGSQVFNETGTSIGKIDDLIVTPNETVPFAVLSVGGFLGVGSKFVVVPYSALDVQDKKIVLRDATKDSLKILPEFKYAK